ncbi:MAG TPA: cupredoxin family copper-binding protein [Patescibacteria group bacterium]|nr:cupredoxin family copper-binding protein [Patescibacteria group bacterium]
MNTNNKIVIGIVLLIVVVGGFIYFTKNKYSSNQQNSTQPAQQSQTGEAANVVNIQNFTFSPGALTVKAGTKVTWVNQDSVTHTIKSDTFNSSTLMKGDKFEFTFTEKGSFDYSCGLHPSMVGKVVVE